ncbi:MAG: methylated-DNA--[protein]-cysteine S-methyltransferase [Duncaniella sp.]|nr:methylated-DNA--[protein]-cysteine S-methyltransferase [Duncaniella sp.]HBI59078.1 hypothetical protein [Porphyromonadaceae bacterium]
MTECYKYNSPLGDLTVVVEENFLTGIWYPGHEPAGLPARVSQQASTTMMSVVRWLDTYFGGSIPDFLPPLNPAGTPFRHKVWKQLLTIPYGATTSYGAIAQAIGCRSARAIGNAVGHNPVSIIIPCHRVVGTDGSLTGYAGNLDRKSYLLNLEHK